MTPAVPPPTWARRRQRLVTLVQQAAVVRAGCRWGTPWRGWDGQAFARRVEHAIRFAAVVRLRWAQARHGLALPAVATALGIAPATLRHWARSWKGGRRRPTPRGAPDATVPRATRNQVFTVLALLGSDAPLGVLGVLFPDVPRALLRDFRARVRTWLRHRTRAQVMVVRWTRPGTVWAMDFRVEDAPTDGRYPYTFTVRDLASHRLLAAEPTTTKEAWHVVGVLARLFAVHGAPLVLKSDNGAEVTAADIQALCERWGVWPLLNPPYTPQYNGAIEAGGGQLAVRAWEHAARHGRPAQWTCDDLAWARDHANATGRPFGPDHGTPDERWAARVPITAAERAELRQRVERAAAPARYYTAVPHDSPLDPWQERNLARAAIVQACIESNLLTYRRRRISPPKSAARWGRIA